MDHEEGVVRRCVTVAVSVATLLLLTACGGGAPEGVSGECASAFEQAAAVSDLQDTHEDLFPAYSACKTLDEWKAADDAYPDAMDGVDPIVYARNVCDSNSARLGSTPICQAAANE